MAFAGKLFKSGTIPSFYGKFSSLAFAEGKAILLDA